MKNWNIHKKLLILFFISAFAAIIIFSAGMYSSNQLADAGANVSQKIMLDGEKDKIKTATDSIASALAVSLKGIKDSDKQIEILRKSIKDYFFEADKSGYYFAYKGTVNVAHAAKPELQGKDLKDLKGTDGVYSIRELNELAHAGGDFLYFTFDKPGKGIQPKLGYATMIPGTDYWIGTGIYIDNIEDESAAIAATMHEKSSKMMILEGIIFVVLFFLLLLPMSLMISRGIVHPIRETTEAAESIAAGNFDITLQANGKDEVSLLQKALNSMAAELRDMVRDLSQKEQQASSKAEEARQAMKQVQSAKEEADRKTGDLMLAADELESVVSILSSSSEELSAQIEQSSHGAEIQSSRVSESATSMEQMEAIVLEVAQNAAQAAETADETKVKAQEGAAVVKSAINGIEAVHKQFTTIKNDIDQLGQQAQSIGQIMDVISDIADQTNLLALNAAIEAARAGEAGRGFAVVADEVRKLAEKTMSATKEVGQAISDIQEGTRRNIESVEQSVVTIQKTTELADQSGRSLEAIVAMVDSTTDQVRSIATAAEEQSSASSEINRNIAEINQISMETATTMRESSDAVVQLSQQAMVIKGLIDKMKSE